MALVVALQQSSFVRLCSWPALTRRHCARVLKWRARVVHAKYSTRPSKIPTLMRYIPKEARKTDSEKLESVHFPSEHLRSHEDSGEEVEEYNAEDSDFEFNSQSYASEDYLPTWKSTKFAYDQSRSQPAPSRKTYQENMQSQFPAEASLKPRSENRSHTVSAQSWNPGSEHVRKDEGERINRPENDPTAKPHQKELQSVAAFEATRETGLKVNTQPDMRNCRTEHVSESEAEEIELFESEKVPSRNTYQKELQSRFPALQLVPASEVTPRSIIVSRKAKTQAETLNHKIEHPSKKEVEEDEMEEFVSRHDSKEESQDEDESLITIVNLEEDESLIPVKHRELTASDNPGERSAAKNYAIFLLGKGQKTAAELKRKLRDKNYSSQVIDSTISDLRKAGLQNDTSYADVFTQSRWNARGWGPKRIKHELLQKGVDVRNIDRALVHVFKEDSSGKTLEESEESRWDMSKPAEEHLLALAARKWKSGGNISDEARKRRLAGWLQRRGFSWKVITGVIGTLQGKKLLTFDEDLDEE